MNLYGIEINLKHVPELDPDFFPLQRFNEAFLQKEMQPAYGISKISVRSNNLSTTIIFFPTTKAAQPALR